MEAVDNENGKHESAWTTDEIRRNGAHWTLAGDIGLFHLLEEFSHNIISQTHKVENSIDALVHQTKMASIKINNTINDFHMLSNLQFVENRVYDEEVQEIVPEEKSVVEKTKEQKEAEMLPKIKAAVELGLAVLEQSFDKINVNEISDSDDEDLSSEGRTILEPKDPYEFRPLPFIIGSVEFQNCDYAGLKDLIQEEVESSIEEESVTSETDETSDEGEPLPQDEDKFSRNRNAKAQSFSDGMSSSDASELFGSDKEENGFASDSSFEKKVVEESKHVQQSDVEMRAEEKEKRHSVSSLQSKLHLPQVLPVPNKKKDDLFTNADELSDDEDESPFRKKNGLFSSDVHFGDEKDLFGNDLFEESIKVPKKEEPKSESPKISQPVKKMPLPSKSSKQLDLFANDEDSDEDIFNTLMKSKIPISKGSRSGSQDLSEKAESSSTPSSAPSSKPSGNAFDFVTGSGNVDSLFGDESDVDDLFSNKKKTKKLDFNAFDEDDDLFGITSNKSLKKSEVVKANISSEKKGSLFNESESFEKMSDQNKPSTGKKLSLFEDSDSFEEPIKIKVEEEATIVKPSKKNSIFEDIESSDQDSLMAVNPPPVASKSKTEKSLSLFDDDDDDDDDIFSQVRKVTPKVPVQKKDEQKSASLTKQLGDAVLTEPQKKEDSSAAVKPKSVLSSFEDSDLFSPKSPAEKTEPVKEPPQVSKPPLESAQKRSDYLDDSVAGKSKDSSLSAEESGIDFDVPINNTKTLNVISKDRVKGATKRRLPSRRGRTAFLETSNTAENGVEEKHESPKEDPKPSPSAGTSYIDQEKKKMNLMSQLISEVSASKVGKKNIFQTQEDDDDVDIFAEAANKSQAKKPSFSFLPPAENSVDAVVETKENVLTETDDWENDEFFAEPSFKTFRSSVSHADPVLVVNPDDNNDDDDDDLFSPLKTETLPKPSKSDTNDLFDDDSDIFADIQKEKYELFPSQLYSNENDDDDDDIFGSLEPSSATDKTKTVKKTETQKVNAFDDPLTGLLGED